MRLLQYLYSAGITMVDATTNQRHPSLTCENSKLRHCLYTNACTDISTGNFKSSLVQG